MTKALLLFFALAGIVSMARAQDAAAGEKKVSTCIGCHGIPGYQATFPEVYRVPMIAGQNEKYLVSALNAYKKGDRKHPTMRAVAGSMSEQDMADVAAFYHQQGHDSVKPVADAPAREAPPAVAALLTRGACTSCHGANYSKPIDPSYPKLAGQNDDYLYAALKAYQTEGNPKVGRSNAVMSGIARQFSHAELKSIAQYIGSLPSELRTVPQSRFR